MLAKLIRENAPEYAIASTCTDFHSQAHNRFIRSKARILTEVISSLMPVEEEGRFMVRGRDADWYNTNISFDFRRHI